MSTGAAAWARAKQVVLVAFACVGLLMAVWDTPAVRSVVADKWPLCVAHPRLTACGTFAVLLIAVARWLSRPASSQVAARLPSTTPDSFMDAIRTVAQRQLVCCVLLAPSATQLLHDLLAVVLERLSHTAAAVPPRQIRYGQEDAPRMTVLAHQPLSRRYFVAWRSCNREMTHLTWLPSSYLAGTTATAPSSTCGTGAGAGGAGAGGAGAGGAGAGAGAGAAGAGDAAANNRLCVALSDFARLDQGERMARLDQYLGNTTGADTGRTRFSSHPLEISAQHAQLATRSLHDGLARHAMSEGFKAMQKLAARNRARLGSLTQRLGTHAGLVFPVAQVGAAVARCTGRPVTVMAAVFFSAVLEYLCAELCEIGWSSRMEGAVGPVTGADVYAGALHDAELSAFLHWCRVLPSRPVAMPRADATDATSVTPPPDAVVWVDAAAGDAHNFPPRLCTLPQSRYINFSAPAAAADVFTRRQLAVVCARAGVMAFMPDLLPEMQRRALEITTALATDVEICAFEVCSGSCTAGMVLWALRRITQRVLIGCGGVTELMRMESNGDACAYEHRSKVDWAAAVEEEQALPVSVVAPPAIDTEPEVPAIRSPEPAGRTRQQKAAAFVRLQTQGKGGRLAFRGPAFQELPFFLLFDVLSHGYCAFRKFSFSVEAFRVAAVAVESCLVEQLARARALATHAGRSFLTVPDFILAGQQASCVWAWK